jgi:hypothetical protein
MSSAMSKRSFSAISSLPGIDFQNSFDFRTQLNLARCRNG